MRPRVIALALAFLSLPAMPAAAETVRIAHPPELTPFISVKDGKTVGLVADILRAAAAQEGIDLVFVPASFAELRGTLTNGTADALAPSVIAEGSPSYDFTTTLTITGGALFVRVPNPTPAGFAALSGKTVVTPKTGPFVGFIQQNFPEVKLEPTTDYTQSLDRVISGQADAAALNIREGAEVVAASYAGKITVPTTMFQELPLGLAVIKGQHADLVKRLDAGLAAIRADGTLQRIEEKWKGLVAAGPRVARSATAGLSHCEFHSVHARWEGSCGPMFDETPRLTLSPAKAITTGAWRKGMTPTAVWAGDMTNEGHPNGAIELEIYPGATGVLRTEYGWFPVSDFSVTATTLQFALDSVHEVPPSGLDRQIVERAAAILGSTAVWNRADNRRCPATATTWSIYCAVIRASIDVTGASHHRRPAMEVVRQAVEARVAGRRYHHRLMDYNNDPSTRLEDVRSLFAEVLARDIWIQ